LGGEWLPSLFLLPSTPLDTVPLCSWKSSWWFQ
jgi:hypothetical protein